VTGATQLIVIQDGILHYVPFETLIGQDGQHLVEHQTISYAPSASILPQLKRDHTPDVRKELLAVGDPTLPSIPGRDLPQLVRAVYTRAGFSFGPLPYAGRELNEIAGLFPAGQVKIIVGAQLTEATLKRERLAEYKRLHFASHALVDERVPDRSGIVLSAAADGEDGILRVPQILRLRIDADLVVLSACQTALGKLVRGEGMLGLSRAFLTSGAARVIVSGWEVNDLSTADFMKTFYTFLRENIPPAEALRQAKLSLLHSSSPAYRHPYYWAPFILLGRPD
jgi:CHAT domain-containing protein